ncbi:MAG: hypothetical protein EOP45_09595 [Sphingobacteriaceae bacterium]|nr:MAG: hypothetical protein EOP45_09595 [Sphingobacteriaceae bacterium]
MKEAGPLRYLDLSPASLCYKQYHPKYTFVLNDQPTESAFPFDTKIKAIKGPIVQLDPSIDYTQTCDAPEYLTSWKFSIEIKNWKALIFPNCEQCFNDAYDHQLDSNLRCLECVHKRMEDSEFCSDECRDDRMRYETDMAQQLLELEEYDLLIE